MTYYHISTPDLVPLTKELSVWMRICGVVSKIKPLSEIHLQNENNKLLTRSAQGFYLFAEQCFVAFCYPNLHSQRSGNSSSTNRIKEVFGKSKSFRNMVCIGWLIWDGASKDAQNCVGKLCFECSLYAIRATAKCTKRGTFQETITSASKTMVTITITDSRLIITWLRLERAFIDLL